MSAGFDSAPESRSFVDRLSKRTGETVCWLFLVAAALSCYEVLMDWLFRAPTVWVHDSTIMLCSACFLLGGAYALERGDHIRITVVYELFSARWRRRSEIFTTVLSLIYLIALSLAAGKQSIDSIMRVERSGRAWDFPMPMVIRTLLFLGAALLFLQACSHLMKLVHSRAPHR
ncbi:MAG: TRAP transporter small permease subunit [Gammaproteobacteria bacterium]